jgi:hypothetical protein
MESIAGAKVEHKYYLSVHFHCVQEEVIERGSLSTTDHMNLPHQIEVHEQLVLIASCCIDWSWQEWNVVEEEVRLVLKEYLDLTLTHGRKVRISHHIRNL